MTTTTDAPRFKTTVDQDRGPHSSGARYTQLTDVITDFSDYSQEKWGDLSADDRAWWVATVADIHEARVALAELPQEAREQAQERLDEEACDDLENYAATVRRIIADEAGD